VTDQPAGKRRRRAKVIALDPHAGAVVLDPRDPMQAARALVAARFTDQQHRRLLHRHRGTFWRFQENHYVLARSMADLGLLQPIVIRPDDRLIAGHRRLAAARLLATTASAGEFGNRDANNLASGDGQRSLTAGQGASSDGGHDVLLRSQASQGRGRNWTSAGAGVCGDRFRCTPYG
jgi:hypothetical protein